MSSERSTSSHLESFTHGFSKWAGSGLAFLMAVCSVVLWIIAGAFCDYSERWNSAFTAYIGVITFLMIFLVQRTQNKELLALHVKLNELIATSFHADNRIINIEKHSEAEILDVHASHSDIKNQSS